MIKQSKKRLVATVILLGFVLACMISVLSVYGKELDDATSISDVVESKSVIDEQIVSQTSGITSILAEELAVASTQVASTHVEEKIFNDGWTTTSVNVRQSPSVNTTVLTTYDFNTQISYIEYDNEWVEIEYGSGIAFIAKEFISNTKNEYNEISVPANNGFKSFMDYRAITNTSSIQYKIQINYAYTGEYGIRQVEDRFCAAIGSYFGVEIGQYFDLVLENGIVIPCIAGDAKADKDTDSQHIFHANGCCSEFIIDNSELYLSILNSGDISSACEDWNSPVIAIRIYEENILK